jgi:LPS O-antigen subunit length determinant protein (WzzB/FepE family)
MADQKPLKSSLELAMERFRKSDEAAGVETTPLTDAQKAAIAEARNFCEAKQAEQQVLHESRMRKSVDLAEREAMDQEYRRHRERLASERDAKIEKIRRASG